VSDFVNALRSAGPVGASRRLRGTSERMARHGSPRFATAPSPRSHDQRHPGSRCACTSNRLRSPATPSAPCWRRSAWARRHSRHSHRRSGRSGSARVTVRWPHDLSGLHDAIGATPAAISPIPAIPTPTENRPDPPGNPPAAAAGWLPAAVAAPCAAKPCDRMGSWALYRYLHPRCPRFGAVPVGRQEITESAGGECVGGMILPFLVPPQEIRAAIWLARLTRRDGIGDYGVKAPLTFFCIRARGRSPGSGTSNLERPAIGGGWARPGGSWR
jgi:hypothetical protein